MNDAFLGEMFDGPEYAHIEIRCNVRRRSEIAKAEGWITFDQHVWACANSLRVWQWICTETTPEGFGMVIRALMTPATVSEVVTVTTDNGEGPKYQDFGGESRYANAQQYAYAWSIQNPQGFATVSENGQIISAFSPHPMEREK